MEHMFKRRLRSAAFLVLFPALLSGCGFFENSHTLNDLFGETRTLPDGDEVDFTNRHTPILNPGTISAPAPDDADQQHTSYNGPASAPGVIA